MTGDPWHIGSFHAMVTEFASQETNSIEAEVILAGDEACVTHEFVEL